MDKDRLLRYITDLASRGGITRQEVVEAFEAGSGYGRTQPSEVRQREQGVNLSRILSFVGGGIVFLGLVIFVAQFFDELNPIARVLVTLGSGIVAYVVGVLLGQRASLDHVSQAFYLIAALLLPGGLYVVFQEFGPGYDILTLQSIIAALVAAVFVTSYFLIERKNIFLLFSIAAATWFVYAFLSRIAVGAAALFGSGFTFYVYLTLVVGVSYVLLGYGLRGGAHKQLTPTLYFFGLLGALTATVSLGGVWDILFVGVVFGVLLLSIYIKSRVFLLLGGVFLVVYIIKITARYFADSGAWPIALIIAGLALIGVGYLTYYLHSRYLARREQGGS